ncbi:AzlD domain-containing protein [Streptomyces sp. ODS28]|uniref:AzlD domain-containing protein n=1 Tax=Streptomyces sp. ODS28 TaxID=3136688 RepID=UPI0031F0E5D0
MSWTWLAAAVAGCFALKLLGLLVPERALAHPAVARTADAAPVALLAGLIAVQTFTADQHLTLDHRAAGLLVAALLIWRRAPFLLVVVAAAATTALLRWYGG